MRKFDDINGGLCPKCHGKATRTYAGPSDKEEQRKDCKSYGCENTQTEHFHRRCRECNFRWGEKCADAPGKEPKVDRYALSHDGKGLFLVHTDEQGPETFYHIYSDEFTEEERKIWKNLSGEEWIK